MNNRYKKMKSTVITTLIALCVTCLLPAGASGAISGGPVVNPANGHRYYLLTPNTWTASEVEAIQMGGHLVTINDSAENRWVFDTFSKTGQYGLWIGLNDLASEGTFVWASGETVEFTDWAAAQPDNFVGQEDFGMIWVEEGGQPSTRAERWNDFFDRTLEDITTGGVLQGVVEVPATPGGQDIYVYDANLGTFPVNQGFDTLDDRQGVAAVVTNGVLHTFLPASNEPGVQYYRQTNAPLDFATTPYVMEATLRIRSANYEDIGHGNQRSGYYFYAADSLARVFAIGLSSNGVVINTDVGFSSTQGIPFRPFDTTDAFHTYRFVIEGGRGTLFIDGIEFASLTVGQTGAAQVFPNVAFGDISGVGKSEAELRHFRFASLAPKLAIEVSEVSLCWNSLSNRTYQVQYRSQLTPGAWINLGEPVPGNGTVNCVSDTAVKPRRLYRLLMLP